jgi:hypothetical protein
MNQNDLVNILVALRRDSEEAMNVVGENLIMGPTSAYQLPVNTS